MMLQSPSLNDLLRKNLGTAGKCQYNNVRHICYFYNSLLLIRLVGSLESSLTLHGSVSLQDLPNLPGVRRDVASINPKLYRQFKASRSGNSIAEEEVFPEENSLMSYFEDSSKFDFSRVLSPFPANGSAYNDLSGRYSLVSQKRDRMLKTRSLPYSSASSLPRHLASDSGRVSIFVAYFIEPATPLIEERARKVEIKVFHEDNSIEIIEPRIENCGILQGKFLKRHQIFKPITRISNDQRNLYTIADFHAGAQLDIYNRIYTIVDCDSATKRYMEECGLPFGDPIDLPENLYDPKKRSGMSRSNATRGGTRSKKKQGFFEYDRKVLRFYGVWDSSSTLFGDTIKVKLHYTLADDKIDISAIHERNSGRDPLPTLLKKSHIMKKVLKAGVDPLNASAADYEERPIHWTDLRIGETINVAALKVLLIDADTFTRDFYNSQNLPLSPPIVVENPIYPQVKSEIPPYNGFGSEEDSLQTCKHTLIPSAPMKDGVKLSNFQGMILRYKATLHNPNVRSLNSCKLIFSP